LDKIKESIDIFAKLTLIFSGIIGLNLVIWAIIIAGGDLSIAAYVLRTVDWAGSTISIIPIMVIWAIPLIFLIVLIWGIFKICELYDKFKPLKPLKLILLSLLVGATGVFVYIFLSWLWGKVILSFENYNLIEVGILNYLIIGSLIAIEFYIFYHYTTVSAGEKRRTSALNKYISMYTVVSLFLLSILIPADICRKDRYGLGCMTFSKIGYKSNNGEMTVFSNGSNIGSLDPSMLDYSSDYSIPSKDRQNNAIKAYMDKYANVKRGPNGEYIPEDYNDKKEKMKNILDSEVSKDSPLMLVYYPLENKDGKEKVLIFEVRKFISSNRGENKANYEESEIGINMISYPVIVEIPVSDIVDNTPTPQLCRRGASDVVF